MIRFLAFFLGPILHRTRPAWLDMTALVLLALLYAWVASALVFEGCQGLTR